MSGVFIPSNVLEAIQISQFVRNGLSPVAELQNLIAERAGYWARTRSALRWQSVGSIGSIPTSQAAERTRWRFAFHAGPFDRYVWCRMWMARQNFGTAADCYTRLRVTTRDGTLLGDAVRHYGSSGVGSTDVPSNFGAASIGVADTDGVLVEVTPNTTYFGKFTDFNGARLISACVYSVALEPDTDDGYAAVDAASGSAIYDLGRATPAVMANQLWAYQGQPLFHWASDTDALAPSQGLAGLSGTLSKTLGALTVVAEGTVVVDPPVYQAQSSLQSTTSTSVSVSWPTHTTNDMGLLFIVGNTGTVPSLSGGAGGSNGGWTYLGGAVTTAEDLLLAIYRRRATSGSESAITVDLPGNTQPWLAQILTVRGCVTSGDPVNISNGSAVDTADTAVSVPNGTLTTTTGSCLVIAGLAARDFSTTFTYCTRDTAWANASVSSVTQLAAGGVHGNEVINNRSLHVVAGLKSAAGSSGNFTCTIDPSGKQARFAFALKP